MKSRLYAALLHFVESFGQALDLINEFLVLFGKRCKSYTVLGYERLESLFERGGVDYIADTLVHCVGESTE